MIARVLFAAATIACLQIPRPAAADDCDRGRELFDRAIDALGEGQAALGRDLLYESAEVCPRFATFMNLAIALRRTGETPRALELLRDLLAGRHGELDPERRADVEAQIELAVGELATLRVRVRGPERARVEVDGEEVGESTGRTPFDIPIAAGDHLVRIAADGWSARRERVTVTSGEVRDLTLVLSQAPNLESEETEESSFPTAWVVGGVIALAVVGAVVAIVWATTRGEEQDPRVVGTFETLRFP
jgi:hypothetical protein